MMGLRLFLLLLLMAPLSVCAQTTDENAQHYAVRYIKDHFYLRDGDDFNVIDTDIEWPEIINHKRPLALQQRLNKALLESDGTNFDSLYVNYRRRFGQQVTGQLEKLPDDNRYCYVTIEAKIKSYNPGKWISYCISYSAVPESLSKVKAKSTIQYITYDIARDKILETNQVVRQGMIQAGNVEQSFFSYLFSPLSDEDFDQLMSVSIDGAWPEDAGNRIGFKVSCQTSEKTLQYEVLMPYDEIRYLVTREGRKMIENKTGVTQPEYIKLPQTWNGQLVYKAVDEMPVFMNGEKEMKEYLANVVPPANAKNGRTMLAFVVDRQGSVQDVRVVGGLSPETDRHAVGIVKGMPKFTPGKQAGEAVCVRMYLPIYYKE